MGEEVLSQTLSAPVRPGSRRSPPRPLDQREIQIIGKGWTLGSYEANTRSIRSLISFKRSGPPPATSAEAQPS